MSSEKVGIEKQANQHEEILLLKQGKNKSGLLFYRTVEDQQYSVFIPLKYILGASNLFNKENEEVIVLYIKKLALELFNHFPGVQRDWNTKSKTAKLFFKAHSQIGEILSTLFL